MFKILLLSLALIFFTSCKLLKTAGIQYKFENCNSDIGSIKNDKFNLDNVFYTGKDVSSSSSLMLEYESNKKYSDFYIKAFKKENFLYFQFFGLYDNSANLSSSEKNENEKIFYERARKTSEIFYENIKCSKNRDNFFRIDFKKSDKGETKQADNLDQDIVYF
jgi:hypothetical protein